MVESALKDYIEKFVKLNEEETQQFLASFKKAFVKKRPFKLTLKRNRNLSRATINSKHFSE